MWPKGFSLNLRAYKHTVSQHNNKKRFDYQTHFVGLPKLYFIYFAKENQSEVPLLFFGSFWSHRMFYHLQQLKVHTVRFTRFIHTLQLKLNI